MSFFGDVRAHPFQSLLSTVAGGLVPGGSIAAHALFNRYNNNQFNNNVQQSYANGAAQGNQAESGLWGRPLNGQLGQQQQQSPSMFDMLGNGSGMFDALPPDGSNGSLFVPNYAPPAQQVPNSPTWGQQPRGGGDNNSGAGMQAGPGIGRGDFGMLPGGGMNGVMNGASSATLADFAHAGLNGDWTALLQSHYGANGPNRIAAAR
jgi:hypothetical protein